VYLKNPPDYEGLKEQFAWEVTSQKESEARKHAEPVLHAASSVFKRLRGRVVKRNKIFALSVPLIVQSSKQHVESVTVNLF
jgi:hypothetical protein